MTTIRTFDCARFAKVCGLADKEARIIFGYLPDMQDRFGAYFCAGDSHGIPMATIGEGAISTEKRRKYKRISEEKVARVALLNKYAAHIRSRESADDVLERYTGGITVPGGAYGVSGYPADVDECLSVAVAYAMGDLLIDGAEARLSRNPLKASGMQLLRDVAAASGR